MPKKIAKEQKGFVPQPVDYKLLNSLYRFKYLDLAFIGKNIYTDINGRYDLTKRINELVKENLVIKFSYVKNKLDIIDSIIYTLTAEGFELAQNKYDWSTFDELGSKYLRQGYEHNIIIANFLYDYKKLDPGGEIFDEKSSYHSYQVDGEKRSRIIRPDGAYFTSEGYLFLIEYEHSNDRRDLRRKLNRYNDYILNKRYLECGSYDNILDRIKYVTVLLVTSEDMTRTTIKNIQSLNLGYQLLTTTVHKWIDNPKSDIYYDVKSM